MEWAFECADPVEADIEVASGLVEVEARPGEEIRVVLEAVSGPSGRSEEIIAESTVSLEGHRLRINVPEHGIGLSNRSVLRIPGFTITRSLEVRCLVILPSGSSVTSRTASADLRCGGALAALNHTTASGDVSFDDVSGDATIKVASADVEGNSVGGRLRMSGASGDVRVEQVTGEVNVNLASGDIHLGRAEGPVTVKTLSGDVDLDSVRSGRLQANTASGDIRIGVVTGVAARLDVTSVTGDLSCNVPVSDASSGPPELEIVCRSVSGDVRIEAA